MKQLIIILLVFPLQNWYPILYIESEAMYIIIQQRNVLYLSILNQPLVLYEEPVLCKHTMIPTQYPAEVLLIWVKCIGHLKRIVLGRSCKDDDFEILGHLFLKRLPMGPCREPLRFFIINGHFKCCLFVLILALEDNSLIEIKVKSLFLEIRRSFLKLYAPRLDKFLGRRLQALCRVMQPPYN